MSKNRFSRELKKRLLRCPGARPFLCSGHPSDAKIFIVGFNAATPMDEPFSKFWKAKTGMKLKKFNTFYLSQTKNGKPSPTRRRIDKIAQKAGKKSWLATNVYWTPTPKETDLPQAQKQESDFVWLMGACNPKKIIAHGKKAQAAVAAWAKGQRSKKVQLINCVHLSRITTADLQAVLAQIP